MGAYWARTGDLCRVKAYRVVSGTPAASRRTAETPCSAWGFQRSSMRIGLRRFSPVRGPRADQTRTKLAETKDGIAFKSPERPARTEDLAAPLRWVDPRGHRASRQESAVRSEEPMGGDRSHPLRMLLWCQGSAPSMESPSSCSSATTTRHTFMRVTRGTAPHTGVDRPPHGRAGGLLGTSCSTRSSRHH